ncbi:MAG TPA: hypothetical protein VFP67_11495 [Acidimicrobiia bacterium]|nr:hypothetical protein [Acidimicrobiia bacterium]
MTKYKATLEVWKLLRRPDNHALEWTVLAVVSPLGLGDGDYQGEHEY